MGNLSESFSKALAVFLLEVFCEIIVRISVSKGLLQGEFVHSGNLKVFSRVSRTLEALFLSICNARLNLKTINSESVTYK